MGFRTQSSFRLPVAGRYGYLEAVNVHDFAWTADPTYRIEKQWVVDGLCFMPGPGTTRFRLAECADYTTQIIETFSRDFGSYLAQDHCGRCP